MKDSELDYIVESLVEFKHNKHKVSESLELLRLLRYQLATAASKLNISELKIAFDLLDRIENTLNGE